MLVINLKWLLVMLPVYWGLAKMGQSIIGAFSEDWHSGLTSMLAVTLSSFGRFYPGKSVVDSTNITLFFYSMLYFIALFWSFSMYMSFGLKIYYTSQKKIGYHAPTLTTGGKGSLLSNFFLGLVKNFSVRNVEVYIFLCPETTLG